jgi:exopolyphosphatase/guanosine-5'-triphosphate,3'-diphosphate pyrophosphatase
MAGRPAHAAGEEAARTSGAPRLAVVAGGRGRPDPERLAAVVDLGSNSWRLVVYAYRPGASWRTVGELSEPVRIAEGLGASGKLGPAAIARGIETLEMFARYCEARGVAPRQVDAVATSAIRDAANREALLVPARRQTGFDVEVLSAEEEARLGFIAAVNSSTLTDGAVLDIGGGSLQLTAVQDRAPTTLGSWPLGAVRVTERLLPGAGPASRRELRRARAAVRADLDGAGWLGTTGSRVIAMGGAVRNLAAAVQRLRGEATASIQGAVLERGELESLVRALARLPASERALPGIKAARADIVLGAAVVLEGVLELGGLDRLEVTRAGLREGVFLSRRLLAGADPLLRDVRSAAIRNLAVQCGADLAHAEHVARLALSLHDSAVAEGVIEPAPHERELLGAAALLHDVGRTIAYDGHAAHSEYLILNAGLAGYAPREVALIAQMVRHHRKGAPDPEIARPTLLLRIAEQLECGEDQCVRDARLVARPEALELRLRGDDRLARWGFERRVGGEAFVRAFGRPLTLTP